MLGSGKILTSEGIGEIRSASFSTLELINLTESGLFSVSAGSDVVGICKTLDNVHVVMGSGQILTSEGVRKIRSVSFRTLELVVFALVGGDNDVALREVLADGVGVGANGVHGLMGRQLMEWLVISMRLAHGNLVNMSAVNSILVILMRLSDAVVKC